ncbi:YopX family protein [Campylobacter sp. RM16188]|uniref:YopX family protein n=1 Tax=Campylobacter sp. RM16188 TaxID=1705725 RepID=UPI001556E956|nr:YopX family protein [Campylobacter sp. RM16188]
MIEIKFKAWDKKLKRVREVVRLDFSDFTADLFHITPTNSRSYLHQRRFADIELMQYTGFKDANGVEIYTGYTIRDLVVSPSGYEDSDENFVDTTPSNPVGVIELKDGCFIANFGDYTMPLNSTYSQADKTPITNFWEIIGNIYQNCKTLEAE